VVSARAGEGAQPVGTKRARPVATVLDGGPSSPNGHREPAGHGLVTVGGGRTIDVSARAEDHVRSLLTEIGEDPHRQGLLDTPKRVRKSLAFLTQGYQQDPREILGKAIFDEDYDEMVLVKDIEFYSLCEHHMLPFFGKAHVAYLPDGRIVGLSKLPRLVDVFARRLQVQERLTTEIAEALHEVLRPRGVGVVVEASHLCMMMRGVQKQESATTTSCFLGQFKDDRQLRAELMAQVRGR
jgi:GTP cyclohydrolase I